MKNQNPLTTKDTKEHKEIAGIPPQKAKTGLSGDPGIAVIADIARDRKSKTTTRGNCGTGTIKGKEREMKKSQPIYGGVRDDFGFREGEDARGFTQEESALWYKSDAHEHHLNVMQQRDERRLREHQEAERQAWPATRAGQLLKKLGECFAEYKECLEHDPRLMEKALAFDEMNQKIFNKMRTTMERAHQAPRCRHPRVGGGTCCAPRVRGKKYCHMHEMLEAARPEKIDLPNLGDAYAIHGAIAKGAQAVVDGKLDYKQASILGYYL